MLSLRPQGLSAAPIIDDENTGISKSELEQPCNSTIYDVNGRKVVESTLKPGLYIRNGQKVVVK